MDDEVRRLANNIIALASDEVWEGFYYYSTESYEKALKEHVRSVHFTLTVPRNANGSFTASADEDGDLGKSSIEGRVDKRSGTVTFDKTYAKDTQLSWHY